MVLCLERFGDQSTEYHTGASSRCGCLRYRFKKAWKDGTETVLLEPMDFIARLTAPRFHMLRYHGVFAANAKVRAEVVPQKPVRTGVQLPLFMPDEAGDASVKNLNVE